MWARIEGVKRGHTSFLKIKSFCSIDSIFEKSEHLFSDAFPQKCNLHTLMGNKTVTSHALINEEKLNVHGV